MMTDKAVIRIILILATFSAAFLFNVNCGNAAGAAMERSDFAFAINCGEPESPALCLVGRFKAGTNVSLLESEPGNVCTAKTTSRVEKAESSGAYFTRLYGSCKIPKEFVVAVLKKPVRDYLSVHLKEIIIADTASRIDQAIRNSRVLFKLLKKAQDLVPGKIKELEGIIPKVYEFTLPDSNVFIASYESSRENTGVSGPRVVIINDRHYPLTGWCSFMTLNVFRLNDQHYVQSGSCCCNCGISIMELFRITHKGLVSVVSDGRLSD